MLHLSVRDHCRMVFCACWLLIQTRYLLMCAAGEEIASETLLLTMCVHCAPAAAAVVQLLYYSTVRLSVALPADEERY